MMFISVLKYFIFFNLVFLMMIIFYVMFMILIFGSNVYEYCLFMKLFSIILLMFIGVKVFFYEFWRINFVIGLFFVFVYMVIIVMIFLNMFLVIFNDVYMEFCKFGYESSGDLELFKLMKLKVKKFFKKIRVVVIKVFEVIL